MVTVVLVNLFPLVLNCMGKIETISLQVPIDTTTIKTLYIFVEVSIDTKHLVDTIRLNIPDNRESLASLIGYLLMQDPRAGAQARAVGLLRRICPPYPANDPSGRRSSVVDICLAHSRPLQLPSDDGHSSTSNERPLTRV